MPRVTRPNKKDLSDETVKNRKIGAYPPFSARVVRARERTSEWRKHKLEMGVCPKHLGILSTVEYCHACRPQYWNISSVGNSHHEAQRLPRSGERAKSCFRCDDCGRCYHQGSVYLYENPRKHRGVKEGPKASLLDFDKRKPGDNDKVWSLCGDCRKAGSSEWRYRNYRTWSGLCKICERHSRLETADVIHRTGAVVHRSERHPEAGVRKRKIKVAFTCANRDQGDHKGVTYLSQTKRDDWRGLCSSCLPNFVDPKKITEDITIRNAQLLFSQEDEQGRVPIVYGVCRHRRLAPRQTALGYRHEGRVSGLCRDCLNNPASMVERVIQGIDLQRHDNGKAERETERAIETLWDRFRLLPLPFEKKLRLLTGAEIAAVLNIGAPGSSSSADQLRRKLSKCGVKARYSSKKQWFPSFVRSVVERIERTRQPLSGLTRQ